MKKSIIGLVAGAVAIGASVVPASAGYGNSDTTIWDGITAGACSDNGAKAFEQIVLLAGSANAFDTDGNGKPNYTVFAPLESVLAEVLDDLGLEVSEITPAVAQAIVNDHSVRGSFDQNELEDTDLTRITMRSGFVATVFGSGDPVGRTVPGDVYIAGALITSANDLANGWLYCIAGFVDATPQVPTSGVDAAGAPAPATTESALPDTL